MSFEAHRSLFTGAASRLYKIRRLVSLTDLDTGVIDNTTVFDKEYVEAVGELSTTGTYAGAIIDLYAMLSGDETGMLVTFGDNQLVINDDGVGIGNVPVAGYDLVVGTGDTNFLGDVDIAGTLDVTGLSTLSGGAMIPTGVDFTVFDLAIRYNALVSVGYVNFVKLDSYGNTVITNPYSVAEITAIGETNRLSGDLVIEDDSFQRKFVFHTDGTNCPTLIVCSDIKSVPVVDETTGIIDSSQVELSLVQENMSVGPQINLVNANATYATQTMRFISTDLEGWEIKRDRSAVNDTFKISRSSDTFGDVIPLYLDGENVEIIGNTLRVHAISDETVQFVDTYSVLDDAVNRESLTDPYTVGMRMAWRGNDEYTARIALDNYYEHSSFRMYIESSEHASAIPNVAFGSPLGTLALPIDCLNVMEVPFMVGVNCNHRWLNSNHASKEGLWIGRGDSGSTHNAARIWMQDQSGYRSTIMWGTDEELFYSFMQDGVLRTTDDTVPNNFGNSALGFNALVTWSTIETLGTGDAAIELELQASACDIHAGAAVLIEDTAGTTQLWIVDPDLANWSKISVDGKVAVT